jgi:nicotinamidase-related amidase
MEILSWARFRFRALDPRRTPMTTLSDRPNTALLVIDMQQGVVGGAYAVDRVVDNINTLIDKARSENVPVIWVQHSDDEMTQGSEAWQYVPELSRDADEPLVHKRYGDSFEETDLESVLAERKVGRLVVTGAQTDECIRSTLHGALARGYDATLVGDAHTTEDLREWGAPFAPEDAIAYTNMYWGWSKAPGREGGTVSTTEVDFGN